MNRKRLTDEGIKKLHPKEKPYWIYDAIVPRLFIQVYPSGTKAWHAIYYVNAKPRTKKMGEFPAMGVKAARDAARKFEEDPQGALAKTVVGTFGEVAATFMKRHVEATGLRSKSDIERSLGYVLKRWSDRSVSGNTTAGRCQPSR